MQRSPHAWATIVIGVVFLFLVGGSDGAAAPRPLTGGERQRRLDEIREGIRRTVRDLERRLARPGSALTTRDLSNAALFTLVSGGEPRQAERLLRLALAGQDLDPRSPRYGALPWQSGGSEVTDENALPFGTQALGPILLAYGDRLSGEFRKGLAPHLRAALAGLRNRRMRLPDYTNIFLMRAVNLILLGEAAGDAEAASAGYAELDRWLAYTRRAGIHEFDSPTYYGVDLNCLGLGYRFARRAEGRAKFAASLDYFWSDIAANCFTGRLAGPHARSYDFLRSRGGVDFYLYAEGLCPALKFGKVDLEKTYLLVTLTEKGYHPGPAILGLAGLPERVVRQRWDTPAGADRYHYLTADFAIGSTSGRYGPQDRLLSVALASRKDLPVLSVVPDVFDEPYGKRRRKDRSGHSKPTHLPLNAVAVQHRGVLLALLALDPAREQPTTSLISNVLLPARADALVLDGKRVAVTEPFTTEARRDAVIGVREGQAGVAVRVFRADGCAGQAPTFTLAADRVGLRGGAARFAVSHYRGSRRKLKERHVRVGLLILAERCPGEGQFQDLLRKARAVRVREVARGDRWEVKVSVGDLRLEAGRDLKRRRILYRRVDGRDVPRLLLSVNDKDLAAAVWQSPAGR
jgi:hypothetical protein